MLMDGLRIGRDLTGETFGSLTVMGLFGRNLMGRVSWSCRCACGADAVIPTADLTTGNTKSCGCRRVAAGRATGMLGRLDVPSYDAAHARVLRERGKAKYHGCADCGAPAEDWSYDGTDPDEFVGNREGRTPMRYSGKPVHYAPRCRPCHRAFDRTS